MKKLLLLAFILFSSVANAVTLAPSPNIVNTIVLEVNKQGNDANTCTQSRPCLTIGRAATVATQPNTIIYVRKGTYDVTAKINLAVGVSLQCQAGVTIRPVSPFPTGVHDSIINAVSAEGTFGNQSITGCNFDGNSRYGKAAIEMVGRSYFEVSRNTFTNFDDHAVDFHGTVFATSVRAFDWAIGNKFNYNTITNSACGLTCSGGYNRGAFQMSDQVGLEVIGNTFTQTGRGINSNGWFMKSLDGSSGFNGGLRKGKILYNTLTRDSLIGDTFSFMFEIGTGGVGDGTEVAYNNIIGGGFDTNGIYNHSGGSETALDFHHNLMGPATATANCVTSSLGCAGNLDIAILFEINTAYVKVHHNIFRNVNRIISFQNHTGGFDWHDITVSDNLGYNICSVSDGGFSTANQALYNYNVLGNTFVSGDLTHCLGNNTALSAPYQLRNMVVQNNIIYGFAHAGNFFAGSGAPFYFDGIIEENNAYFLNSSNNRLWFNGITPTNYFSQNNYTSSGLPNNFTPTDPLFVNAAAFNFKLQAGSPLRNTGKPDVTQEDIEHRARYINNPPSIGAYSF